MHMERCKNCGKPHEVNKHKAVTIDGKHYCRPACANEDRGCPSYKPQ